MQIDWQFASPLRLMLVIVIVAVGFITRRHYLFTEPFPNNFTRRFLTSLRLLVLASLILLIATPSILVVKNKTIEAELVIALDNSASMQIEDSRFGSRWQSGAKYAAMIDSVLVGESVKTHYLSGNGLNGLSGIDGIIPESIGTDIGQLVVQSAKLNKDISNIIVISDGHTTVLKSHVRRLPGLKAIFVGVGDIEGPPDLLIENVKTPEIAFTGEKIIIEADVIANGLSKKQVIGVELKCDGEVKGTFEGVLEAGDSLLHIEIPFIPESAGLQLLELSCGQLVNERFHNNNNVSTAVYITPGRSRILMLTNSPDWDAKFLLRAATFEHRLELFVCYKTPRGWTLSDSLVTWSLPAKKSDWLQWDGVVVGDYDGPIVGLREAVDSGCGLLVLGGNRRLDSITGVRSTGVVTGNWQMRRVESEQQHSLLNGLYGVPVDINSNWISPMSEIAMCTTDELVLLEASGEQRLPLLVVEESGPGRIAWFGSSELWSMQFWQPVSEEISHPVVSLARNMLLWISEGNNSDKVALSGTSNVYDIGQKIEITGIAPNFDSISMNVMLKSLDSGDSTEYSMSESGKDRYFLELPQLEPGKYLLSAGESNFNFAVVESGVELSQVTQDVSSLKSLAKYVGAEYVDGESISNLNDLIGKLDLQSKNRLVRTRYNLASSWWVVLPIVLLLSVEWFVRRRSGML
jgi:hypothetical protein